MPYLKLNGKYIGIDPAVPNKVYADRVAGGLWEEVIVTAHPNNIVDVLFNKTQLQLSINPAGGLEPRPKGTFGDWEQLPYNTNNKTIVKSSVTIDVEGYQQSAPIANIVVNGKDFFINGQRTHLVGCDGFLDYRIWLDQGVNGLAPFMAESKELGFQVRRVFLAGSAKQNGVLDLFPSREPRFYTELKPFVAYLNNNGIIPLLTICVDMQDVMSNKGDRVNHWIKVVNELKSSGLVVLFSYGNEADKNGFDPYEIPDTSGIIYSRGSRTQDAFYTPNGATAAEFHPVRDIQSGRTQMDAVASVYYMQSHGCGMLWLDESYPFDNDDPSTVNDAWVLGRLYATLWALSIFHNRQGQRGQLMGPGTKAKAQAFIKGAKLV